LARILGSLAALLGDEKLPDLMERIDCAGKGMPAVQEKAYLLPLL
jgi:hypothetical protein